MAREVRDTARGLLFVGDVHLTSQRPGTRRDRDYVETVLGKVAQAVEIANDDDLIPVFTGDMFHWSKETNDGVKTRLLRVLCRSRHLCLTNVGNHDKKGDTLSDADTLAVLAESSYPLRAFKTSGPAGEFLLSGYRVGVGFTPHGQAIPTDVEGMFDEVGGVVWVTHHDVAFPGCFAGTTDAERARIVRPHPIAGCGLVANGHMHLYKEPITVEGTTWFNPGSVTRTALDAIDHEPCVWSFVPGQTNMVRHPLRYERDVFDLTGRLVDEVSPGEAGEDGMASAFVALLAGSAADPAATSDGTLLLDELRRAFDEEATPPAVRAVVLELFAKVTARE